MDDVTWVLCIVIICILMVITGILAAIHDNINNVNPNCVVVDNIEYCEV